MPRRPIHNSNYESVAHAKAAIDLHFLARNEHFQKIITHPEWIKTVAFYREKTIDQARLIVSIPIENRY